MQNGIKQEGALLPHKLRLKKDTECPHSGLKICWQGGQPQFAYIMVCFGDATWTYSPTFKLIVVCNT
jgi:hypothetical protein